MGSACVHGCMSSRIFCESYSLGSIESVDSLKTLRWPYSRDVEVVLMLFKCDTLASVFLVHFAFVNELPCETRDEEHEMNLRGRETAWGWWSNKKKHYSWRNVECSLRFALVSDCPILVCVSGTNDPCEDQLRRGRSQIQSMKDQASLTKKTLPRKLMMEQKS